MPTATKEPRALDAAPEKTRERELVDSVEKLRDKEQKWIHNGLPINTDLVPHVGFWNALLDMILLWGSLRIPFSLAKMATYVEDVAGSFVEHLERHEKQWREVPLPHFGSSLEQLFAMIDQTGREFVPSLESIQELNQQKVSHWQIAKMYGLLDANGEPEAWKIREELRSPGSVIPADYVPPVLQPSKADEAKGWTNGAQLSCCANKIRAMAEVDWRRLPE